MRKFEVIFMSYHKTEILSYNVKVAKGSRHFWCVAKFKYFVIITTDKNYVHEETQSGFSVRNAWNSLQGLLTSCLLSENVTI
jgi:hypothetical protein